MSRCWWLIVLLLLAGCSDGEWGKLAALGDPAHVVCYSGDTMIYDGWSTGKITSEANSDGYFFVDAKTKLLVEVSGNCVITRGETVPK